MPLADLKVIDLSTVFAGPHCARYLADFGADVVKVERPSGDTVRNIGWRASDGETLWWKLVNRGKRAVTLDLKKEDDLTTLRKMLSVADVLIENLRPGKLEALGLIPDELIAINPKLVITRLTGFGQTGPYRDRAGFATLAEAMSGFAAINGDPEGGPLLPPIALTDELAGLAAAFATLVAIHGGGGQSVDVNLLETMMQIMGPLMSAWHSEQYLQERLGSGIAYSVPRGTYQASDGGWLAVSTSSDSVAARVMDLIGAADDTRFTSFDGRIAHRDELDLLMSNWVARRTLSEALNEFQNAEAAAAPVMNMQQIAEDPHILDRGSLIELDGIKMQGLIARLSRTPGQIRWPGKVIGADNQDLPVGNECWFDDSDSG
ncbi:MAG: CaiB/BaiF CoA transferase family protein [Actinomycetota bacterium]|jgi:crotonobetainyl-CoA:carnitine CoA-transferase CaiB-like acyl-CoA transferase|nr:CoA transferase [Acidimicrobiales bacterium]